MESNQELVTSLESNRHLDAGDVWIWNPTCAWEVLLESNCADVWIWNPTCGWELPLESNCAVWPQLDSKCASSTSVGIQQAS